MRWDAVLELNMLSDTVEVNKQSGRPGHHSALMPIDDDHPLSVLHIGKYYPPHRGGVETHLHHLVSHQTSRMAVEVVVANDRGVTETERVDGATVTRVASLGTVASMPICPTLPLKLRGRLESIVHLHVPNPWAAQAYLMSGHEGRLVITHHADTLGRPTLRKLVDPFVRRVMERAKAIIVTSKRYLESSEELATFHSKCRVIPLGIDGEPFKTQLPDRVEAIQAKYGPRIIIAVGRLVSYKGFEFLLQAMQDVDATLLLIGDGPAKKDLEAATQKFGIGNKAHLLGAVENLVPYYKAAMMLVLPSVSRAESFGMVQVEAMASGIPVINTEIDSGVPEVSLDGITGITVPPRNAASLAQAIRTLLDYPEVRSRYGQAGLVRAQEEYSAQRMAQSTFEVYQSILI
jgi:glycosyltransferase involved in cell wall biosynthesis